MIAFLTLIPLFFIATFAIDVGWHRGWELLARRRVGELLFNTVRLVVGCSILCAVIGVGAAWLVERTSLPGRRIWAALLVAPLAVPAFVNGYSWVSLTSAVEGFGGALLIVTLSYFPLVFLPVLATLRRLDPTLEEAGATLGQSSIKTFFRVVLPQLRPAILGGTLLVGLHLLAEFGALQMLRYSTFTTGIYDQYQSSFNGPAANMLASVLVLFCLLLLILELKAAGRRRYSRVGAGAPHPPEPMQLGRMTVPAVVGFALLVALSLGVPVGSLAYWLLVGSSTTFDWSSLARATFTSIGLGAAGAVLAVLAALPLARLVSRNHSRLATVFERSTYIASSLPGIVVALALVTASIRWAQPLYQTLPLLLIAYVLMFLPRALVTARSAFKQLPPIYDEVSYSLGVGRVDTLRRVTIPVIAPGLAAGAALVFIAVATELTATLLLAPLGVNTLATEFWDRSSSVAFGAAAPYASLMVLISLPATFLLLRASRRAIDL